MVFDVVFLAYVGAAQECGLVYEAVCSDPGNSQSEVQIGDRFLIAQCNDLFERGRAAGGPVPDPIVREAWQRGINAPQSSAAK